jgi:hypothetical protein
MDLKSVEYQEPRATPLLEKAFEELFHDHEQLSDYIMSMGEHMMSMRLSELRKRTRAGDVGANSASTLWLRRFLSAIVAEVKELGDSIPWKWWRDEKTDMQNVRVEIVDIFHFLLSAAAASGMTGEDFINIYYQKRRINLDRQVHGFKKDDNLVVGTDRF